MNSHTAKQLASGGSARRRSRRWATKRLERSDKLPEVRDARQAQLWVGMRHRCEPRSAGDAGSTILSEVCQYTRQPCAERRPIRTPSTVVLQLLRRSQAGAYGLRRTCQQRAECRTPLRGILLCSLLPVSYTHLTLPTKA